MYNNTFHSMSEYKV